MAPVTRSHRASKVVQTLKKVKKEAESNNEDVELQDSDDGDVSNDDAYVSVIAGLTMGDFAERSVKRATWSIKDKTILVREGIRQGFFAASLPSALVFVQLLLTFWTLPFAQLGRANTEEIIRKFLRLITNTLNEKTLGGLMKAPYHLIGKTKCVTKILVASALVDAVNLPDFSFQWFSSGKMEQLHDAQGRYLLSMPNSSTTTSSSFVTDVMGLLCKRKVFNDAQGIPSSTQLAASKLQSTFSASSMMRHLTLLRHVRELAATAKRAGSYGAAAPFLQEIIRLRDANGGDWMFKREFGEH